MRVLIDAHMVGGQETGNETYIANLTASLSALDTVQCAAAVTPNAKYPEQLLESDAVLLRLKSSCNVGRLTYGLSALSRTWDAQLMHVTYFAPLLTACPLVVSVHDVSFKLYPEFFSFRDRLLFRALLPFSLQRADAVITISEHARKEILRHYPAVAGRVYVTPLAPAPFYGRIAEKSQLDSVLKEYAIEHEFILAVGNIQPRKNLSRLIRAFSKVHGRLKEVQLVIVGKEEWRTSTIHELVAELELTGMVIFTGYVPEKELVLLYNAARVFTYPSIYEGFGLPILEAMACGVPVVTSNSSAMPEVAGDAAILIDPFSEEEIADGILQILSNQELAHALSEAGLRRAAEFTWQHTIEQTVAIYRKVLHDKSGIPSP